MNILFLQGTYPSYGGVERVTTLLSNEFCKRGFGVCSVSFVQPNPEITERDLDKRVKLYKLDYPVSDKENIVKLHKIIVEEKIDIVINQWAALYKVARMIRKAMNGTRCKLITVHHTLPSNNNKIQKAKNAYKDSKGIARTINKIKLELIKLVSRASVRGTYHYSDIYMVLTPRYIPIVQNFIHVKGARKIKALFNPLGEIPAEIPYEQKVNEVLYVGRIDYPEKMTFRLINVWKLIQDKYPSWKLTFVGDGPDRTDMEKRVKEMRLQRVSFEGFQKPDNYYERAKIVVLCSAYEGFPMVLVEGMSHKAVPISVDTFPSVYDIVDDNENGIIVPSPYTDDKFANALERVMNEDSNIQYMAELAYEKSEQFSIGNITDSWIALFNDLLQYRID